jgi:hypothetical protein
MQIIKKNLSIFESFRQVVKGGITYRILLKYKKKKLLVSWMFDKLVYEVADEDLSLIALQVAEGKVKYQKSKNEENERYTRNI